MKINTISSVMLLIAVFLTSCNSNAQNNSQKTTASASVIEVIQFHSEHRCMTCNKIEELTKKTLKMYPEISFKLVNVDDSKNEKIAEKFEATGTALFLNNTKTGKKMDLTDFAFMNARDEEKFVRELKKRIAEFSK